MSASAFRFRMRVRYHECDGQQVVFNSRYGEYLDVAALEFCRELFGGVTPETGLFDWRLVAQSKEWKAPAHFDDVLDVEVTCSRVGTTSFTLRGEISRQPEDRTLLIGETTYVAVSAERGDKIALTAEQKARLSQGAPDVLRDCSGHRAPLQG